MIPILNMYARNIIKFTITTSIGSIRMIKQQNNILPAKDLKIFEKLRLYIETNYNKSTTNNFVNLRNCNAIDEQPKQMEDDQLQDLMVGLNDRRQTLKNHQFKSLMTVIDKECTLRIDKMEVGNILNVLCCLVKANFERITEFNFFKLGLPKLIDHIMELSKEELLQTMFYISFLKKSKNAETFQKKCLKELVKYDIEGLTIEELSIVCNSTFKTSTKVTNSRIMDKILKTISDNLFLYKDPAIFTTLIKTIRHNREQTVDLLSTMSCVIIFNKTFQNYSFTTICHILAAYADFPYYDDKLFKLFIELSVKRINETRHALIHVRNKDITRLLWCMSTVNVNDHELSLNTITNVIQKKVQLGHYRNDEDELINILAYLWILNRRPINLLKIALTEKNISRVANLRDRTKFRLNLLTSCIYFENNQLFNELNLQLKKFVPFNMQYQLNCRRSLQKVFNALKRLSQHDKSYDYSYEVPHINICGITGYKDKRKFIHVEVLDDYVTVRNTKQPIGIMALKLRILKSLDCAIIVINADNVEDLSVKDIQDHLRDEIELLC